MKLDYNFQPKGFRGSQGWYSRGYLPHFDGGEILQFTDITQQSINYVISMICLHF